MVLRRTQKCGVKITVSRYLIIIYSSCKRQCMNSYQETNRSKHRSDYLLSVMLISLKAMQTERFLKSCSAKKCCMMKNHKKV